MMKKTKQILAIALAFLLVFVNLVPVQAANGPYEYIGGNSSVFNSSIQMYTCAEADLYMQGKYIFSNLDKKLNTVSGVSYDLVTNTLTLNNYNNEAMKFYIKDMGDDFRLKLIGTNSIQKLLVMCTDHGSSVNICGNGSLTINQNKAEETPVKIECKQSAAKLTVDNTAGLKVYAQNGKPAAVVENTASSDRCIVLMGNDSLNGKVKSEKKYAEKTEKIYILDSNDEDIRKCTPKANSGFDANAGYGYVLDRDYNFEDEEWMDVIHVYRFYRQGEMDIACPVVDENENIRTFSYDEFQKLFDYAGSLGDGIQVYVVQDEENLSKCTAVAAGGYDTSATYVYRKGTYSNTGEAFAYVYEVINTSQGAVGIPVNNSGNNMADCFDSLFAPDAGSETIAVKTSYQTYLGECTAVAGSRYDTDAEYVYEDEENITVYSVTESGDRKFAFPLREETEIINFADDFATYFKSNPAIPVHADYALGNRSTNMVLYTKADGSSDIYGCYKEHSYLEDKDYYTMYQVIKVAGFDAGLPIDGETEIGDIPSGYAAVPGMAYYNWSYPDSILDVNAAHTHTFKTVIDKAATTSAEGSKHEECTVCGYKKAAVTIPKLEDDVSVQKPGEAVSTVSVNTTLKDSSTNATVKVTNAGKTVNGEVTGAEVAYTKPAASKATVTVPDSVTINGVEYSVTSVAKGAFKNDKKLTKVTIGSNVKTIDADAFSGCKKLTTVKMGKNVKAIGNKAFYKCASLKSVTIPEKVTKLGSSAFSGCKSLKTVTFKGTKAPSIGKDALKGIKKNAAIKVPKKQYNDYKKKLTAKTGYRKTMKIKKA